MGSLGLVLASSVLFSLSHPNFINTNGWGLISFICFVPFFYIVIRSSLKKSFLLGFSFGFISYILLNFWLYNFEKFALLLVPLLRGLEWGLTALFVRIVYDLFKRCKIFFIASVITVSFYLQECFFLGYSYGNIAYALYRHLLLIQCADIFGIWTLVFLISYTNALIAVCFNECESFSHYKTVLYKYRISLIALFCAFLFVFVYGEVKLHIKKHMNPIKELKVGVVQHNADTYKGGYSQYRKNLNTLKNLTYEILPQNPDLIVWSETAIVPSIRWHKTYKRDREALFIVDDFLYFAESLNTPLIFGNGDASIKGGDEVYYNSAFLYENGLKDVYHKQHLVPLSESFPFKTSLQRTYEFLKSKGFNFWDSGSETNVFTLDDGVKIFTPICFEDTFASISRLGVKNGAELLVNLTNDYWSLSRVAATEHLSAAVFRSVENSIPTIRSTNSGASCYISIDGKINNLLPLFKEASFVYDVKLYNGQSTLYTFWGDIPIKVFTASNITLVIFFSLTYLFKRGKIKEW